MPEISQNSARVRPASFHQVSSFRLMGAYTILIVFDDATEQTIDFAPILFGELFGPLSDLQLFNQVRIDPEVHTLVWPNGADFDPATFHDWPLHVQALTEQAKQWELAAVSST